MSESGVRIAVAAPMSEALTYLLPAGAAVVRGQSVHVPLGSRRATGVVLQTAAELPDMKLKPIEQVNDERPILRDAFLQWAEWLAHYYFFPIGMIFESVFPGLSRFTKRKKAAAPEATLTAPETPPVLTDEQRTCIDGIGAHVDFSVHLLHGVTASGKTEVYLHLIDETLKRGRQALVLVPEIALTPQLIDRFSRRFPGQIAVIHSHLAERERTDQWWSAVAGEKRILIGARSALFCPLPDLGLIVVDEEHEPSYKQEEKLKYHARDAAIMLARFTGCPIVLGSATPALETWNNVQQGKYKLHQMKRRVAQRPLPTIEVIDLKEERAGRRDTIAELPFWLSQRLYEELQSTLARKEQAALFLNRRGIAAMAQCSSCGYVEECPNCAVSLTVHRKTHLVCHYCGYTQTLKARCPNCSEGDMSPLGMGTELIEADLRKLFPEARLARADRDEIQTRAELEEMIRSVENRDVDLLIGTQMIAKGLDFPQLTLVGIVMADIGFHWPDFRASERSFQLLTQVSGRAGRHSSEPGRVILQTYNPSHPSIVRTVENNFVGFADEELQLRRVTGYPPFERLALLRVQGGDLERTRRLAQQLASRATQLTQSISAYSKIKVLGPAPAPIAKLRNRFRFQLLIKAPSSNALHHFCAAALADDSLSIAGTKVQVDIDPLHML